MKKRILVIDDEEKIRKIYSRLFLSAASRLFEVVEAADASEATYCLLGEKFDLILLDINLPVLDGRAMYEIIQDYFPELKVIVASVYPIDKQKRMIPDADDYYDKSQGPINLLNKVVNIFDNEN